MAIEKCAAQTVASSTHHNAVGTMTEILKRAAEKGWPVYKWCYRETLKPFRVSVTDQMVFEREGGRSESLIRDFLRLAGRPDDPALTKRLSDDKQRRYTGLGPPALYPGAETLVAHVRRAAHRLGLVTGTRRENVERLIPKLLPHFDVIVSQESYQHDKPHPEPYEKAARALGLAGPRCAAVENAPNGIRSAKAAGYAFVVGLTTTMPREALRDAGADLVVDAHDAAASAIADWARAP